MNKFCLLMLSVVSVLATTSSVNAAEDLKLAEGISFTQDAGVFPILGNKMHDASIEEGKTHLVFFGAAGDLNTNRQAARLVELYNKEKTKGIKFIVIDVDRPASADAEKLINKYYPGYVPAQVVLDKLGKPVWSQVGEVSRRKIRAQIDTTM